MYRPPGAKLQAHLRPHEKHLLSLPCRIKVDGEWVKAEAGLVAHHSAQTGLEEAA